VRPINLIPAEERRGEQAPLRSGPLLYVLVGALVAMLVAVTALVLVGNQIADRESEVARLEVQDAEAKAKAESLAAYIEFRNLGEQRVATVASLADSRFDWERVMRELALVLPSDTWLVTLAGTAAPGVSVEGASGDSALRGAAPGPALQLTGCAKDQEAVARFVTALKDIDGVTRVGVSSSELPEKGNSDQSGGGSDSASDECRTREFIPKFEIVVAFDAAPVSPAASAEGGVPVTTETTTPTETEGEG
jgi:Tfp pilus assembly protein PilN